MKQRLIVCANNATAEQKDQITIFLKSQGLGYWHWFNDVWLVTDASGKWSASSLRDSLMQIVPGCHHLVLSGADPKQWAAWGTIEHFKWLNEDWEK